MCVLLFPIEASFVSQGEHPEGHVQVQWHSSSVDGEHHPHCNKTLIRLAINSSRTQSTLIALYFRGGSNVRCAHRVHLIEVKSY